jgi:hypothetical protein
LLKCAIHSSSISRCYGDGLKIKAKEVKYTLRSCHNNACQNHNTEISSYLFDNAVKFKPLEMTVKNENLIGEKIIKDFISENVC